ncbi:hypothetical protein O1L55_01410 [Streptomyces albulus]|nr:hypothetical protein [Streptomyces noursei]
MRTPARSTTTITTLSHPGRLFAAATVLALSVGSLTACGPTDGAPDAADGTPTAATGPPAPQPSTAPQTSSPSRTTGPSPEGPRSADPGTAPPRGPAATRTTRTIASTSGWRVARSR